MANHSGIYGAFAVYFTLDAFTMTLAALISLAIFLALAGLDCWAIWKVIRSSFYSNGQRLAQIAIVILVPLLGSLLVLYLARPQPSVSSGKYPVEHKDPQDIAFINIDIGHHE
jgi:hypothetical protein